MRTKGSLTLRTEGSYVRVTVSCMQQFQRVTRQDLAEDLMTILGMVFQLGISGDSGGDLRTI